MFNVNTTTKPLIAAAKAAFRLLEIAAGRLDGWASTKGAVWWTCGAVALVHLLPRIVLGTRSIVTTHDGLDSDFLYRVLLTKPGRMFDYGGEIPELLNGVPRVAYPTGASISALLFALMPPFWAYVALEQAVHVIGFLGMYWLLEDHVSERLPTSLKLLLAFTFGCLPYYIIHEASVSGQAAVGWALLHLYKGAEARLRRRAFLAIAAFPFVSVLPTAGAFVVAVAGAAVGVGCLVDRSWHKHAWLGVALLAAMYCVVDFPFVHTMLTHSYVSHRETWQPSSSWTGYFWTSLNLFWEGNYHATSAPAVCVTALSSTMVIALVRKQFWLAKRMLWFLLLLVALAFVPQLTHVPEAAGLRERFTFVRIVNIRTFWTVAPVLFFALALALEAWWSVWRWKTPAVLIALTELSWILSAPPATEPELTRNYFELATYVTGQPSRQVTYRDFLATPVYEAVKEFIGLPQDSYRVISVGIDPARAAFNGFYCADGYHNNYPLEYKERFRKLIAAILDEDDWSRRRFDKWGSRAYAFVPGMKRRGYRPTKWIRTKPLEGINLDHDALLDLGVKYVLTSAQLDGDEWGRYLTYQRSFHAKATPLDIHLYKVRPLTLDLTTR